MKSKACIINPKHRLYLINKYTEKTSRLIELERDMNERDVMKWSLWGYEL